MTQGKPENPILRLLAVPLLVVLGALFTGAALFPAWREWLSRWIGEIPLIYFGVGFLFFYTAVLVTEKNLMRRKFLGLMEEIMGFFFGSDYRRVTETMEILFRGLEASDEQVAGTAAAQLRRLTGKDFGVDPAAWKAWWLENRAAFLLARRKTSLDEGGESDDSSA